MNYIEAYQEANERKFSGDGDNDIRENFYKSARNDVEQAMRDGLIRMMSFEEYLEVNNRTHTTITDEMRRVIIECDFIPSSLLSLHYGIGRGTVSNIRREARGENEDS